MNRVPPILDMTPDGAFRRPPQVGPSLSLKLLVGAVLVTMVAAGIAVAALALWLLSMVLPVLILGGVAAWGMFKYRQWHSLRGARDLRRS